MPKNVFYPQMFGAHTGGVTTSDNDDRAAVQAAIDAAYSVGNGIVELPTGTIFNIATPSSDGYTALIPRPGVTIRGGGTLRLANGYVAAHSLQAMLFDFALHDAQILSTTAGDLTTRTHNLQNFTCDGFTIDMNGTNNSGLNAAGQSPIGSNGKGDAITIKGIRILNSPCQNNIQFGRNSNPPNFTNIKIINTTHENSGDVVNSALTDHSSIWVDAQGCVVSGNTLSTGSANAGSAIELHGIGITCLDNTIDSYHNAIQIANEAASTDPNGNTLTTGVICNGNTGNNVKGGIAIGCRTGASLGSVVIAGNSFVFNASTSGIGIDAHGITGADNGAVNAAGTAINLVITGNSMVYSGLSGSNTTPGMYVGPWQSCSIVGNSIYGSLGPGVWIDDIKRADQVLSILANTIVNPGMTTNTSYQMGILLQAASNVSSISALNIQNNTLVGTMRYGISGGLTANGGRILNNSIVGATVAKMNYTPTGGGVVVGLTSSGSAPNASFACDDGMVTVL